MEQKHTEARTRGRCCAAGWENIRDTRRRETVDMFAKRWGSLFLPACTWTLDLLDFFVWQRAEPTLFAGPGDGCLPLCFRAHVFLGACLWEKDNKIRAPVGHSSRKLTSGSNVGEVTHSHRSAKKTASHHLTSGGERAIYQIASSYGQFHQRRLGTFASFWQIGTCLAGCMWEWERIQSIKKGENTSVHPREGAGGDRMRKIYQELILYLGQIKKKTTGVKTLLPHKAFSV